MSILKGLIKGFEENQDTVNSEMLENNLNGNSVENIVKINLED